MKTLLKVLFFFILFASSIMMVLFGIILFENSEVVSTMNIPLISTILIVQGFIVSAYSLSKIFLSTGEEEDKKNTLIYDKHTMKFRER